MAAMELLPRPHRGYPPVQFAIAILLGALLLASTACRTTRIVQSPRTLPDRPDPRRQVYEGPRQVQVQADGSVSWGRRPDGTPLNLRLCHVHYHDPAEHSTPDCPREQHVEIHYVYADSARQETLGDCTEPLVVIAVLARKGGATDPKLGADANDRPPVGTDRGSWEYRGSTTGTSGGRTAAYWHVIRGCYSISQEDLDRIHHKDPTRPLQDRRRPRPSVTRTTD